MERQGNEIVAGYKDQLSMVDNLEGNFFEEGRDESEDIILHKSPRLVITEFDGTPPRLATMQEKISKDMEWEKITVGYNL